MDNMGKTTKKEAMQMWEQIAFLVGAEDVAPIVAASICLGREAVDKAIELHRDSVMQYELPDGKGGYYLTLTGFFHAVTYNNIMADYQ